ncbi:MAG: type II secretion system protein GspG, partial [Pyrinomonadaceae bacterium]
PLASQPSALAVAWVKVDARFVNTDGSGWKVSEIRTGTRDWVKLGPLTDALNERKRLKARTELETIAKALEEFRRHRGFYIASDQHTVVIDHLSPRYLPQVIRLDPWNQPYKYEGQRDRFVLSSGGPDRTHGTPDDVRLANSSR